MSRWRSIRGRIFLSHFLVMLLPLAIVGYFLQVAVERSGLYLSEWENARQARLIASLLANSQPAGASELSGDRVAALLTEAVPHPTPDIHAKGVSRRAVEPLRVTVTDARGLVLYDSRGELVGADLAGKRDIRLALADQYGSRTSLEPDHHRLCLYSATPVYAPGGRRVLGAVSVSQPPSTIIAFLSEARYRLLLAAAGAVLFAAVFALVLVRLTTTPIQRLTRRARDYRPGDGAAGFDSAAGDEIGELSRAFADLTRRLEGKQYVEQFASNLSHELKTPLAAICGAAELLANGAAAEPEARAKFVRNILKESERLQALVRDLLQLSRLDTGGVRLDRQTCRPERLVAELVATRYQDRLRERGVALAVRVEPGARRAVLDQKRLEQMLGNLLDNALDFTPPGGRIRLTLRRSGRCLVLAVADDGPGVPAAQRERLFSRFFSTPRPETGERGTGLGLCIVRELARAHGGEARVRHRRPRGTEFLVFLPQ